jgi:uncharacterized membrane protein YdjX (TVP38/TMEM64 family)
MKDRDEAALGFPKSCGLSAYRRMKVIIAGILRDRRLHRLAGLAALLGCGVLLAAWQGGLDVKMALGAWEAARGWLADHPVWLFAAILILPALPVPNSALLLLAGSAWGDRPLVGCAVSLAALTLNMVWTYFLAAGPGRGMVGKWLESAGTKLPETLSKNRVRMTVILRLTPGIPFFLQNYALGFLGVPFQTYLPVSFLCVSLPACGFVLGGAGISSGKLGPAITGLSLIVVVVVLLGWVRSRLAARSRV